MGLLLRMYETVALPGLLGVSANSFTIPRRARPGKTQGRSGR